MIAAYVDILDYKREVETQSTLLNVLEAMEYSKFIDHVLFGHLREQMQERGFDCRLYQAAYYLNANGGLTASDLINSIAVDHSVKQISNSALFKREFVDKLVKRKPDQKLDFKGDSDVLSELQKSLKACAHKMDAKFYELPSDYTTDFVDTKVQQP